MGSALFVGTRACNEEFYTKLNEGISAMLATPRGQPCEAIAALLVEIAETARPSLRYQTSPEMKEYVGSIFKDPTGNAAHEGSLLFLKNVIKNQ